MKKGDIVRVNYTGRIKESGELFDTTREEVAEEENAKNPKINYGEVPLILGAEKIVEGLDEVLLKMEVGEEREVEIPPEKGFGSRDPDLIKTVPEKEFEEEEITPVPGLTVGVDGRRGRILSVNSGRVKVDLNHPLSGRNLKYKIKVESKVEGENEKIKSIGEFYLGKKPEIERKGEKVKVFLEKDLPETIKEEIKSDIKEYVKNISEVEFMKKD